MGEKMKKLENDIKKLENKISVLQTKLHDLKSDLRREKEKNCQKHEFSFSATGHNSDLYRCKICGKLEERY